MDYWDAIKEMAEKAKRAVNVGETPNYRELAMYLIRGSKTPKQAARGLKILSDVAPYVLDGVTEAVAKLRQEADENQHRGQDWGTRLMMRKNRRRP